MTRHINQLYLKAGQIRALEELLVWTNQKSDEGDYYSESVFAEVSTEIEKRLLELAKKEVLSEKRQDLQGPT